MLRQAQHERIWTLDLVPHPAAPPVGVEDITATLSDGRLSFAIVGEVPKIPEQASPVRTDGLWQTTCFELFVQSGDGSEYYELNFSPSTAWAAYRFDEYRSNMDTLPFDAPIIEPIEDGVRVSFDKALLHRGGLVGISAVIEEIDGTKSYWALRHPPGPPDFHHPDCFALELPALGAP